MKEKDIIRLFDHIHPDILAETDLDAAGEWGVKVGESDRRRRKKWRLAVKPISGAAAALAIILASVFTATAPKPALGLTSPQYPEGVSFYDYEGKREKLQDLDEDFLVNLGQFAFTSAASVFAQEDLQENMAYSPLSLFYALALATEGAGGKTQKELLQALHMPDIDLVGRESAKLFKHLYTDNEIGKLLLANSLWLQEGVEFNPYYLDKAAQDYYAYSFSVDFTDPETARQMSQWVSGHTGGKLGNDPKAFQATPEQVMSIINTVYFYDQWDIEFDRERTEEDIFYLANGKQVRVPFMNETSWGHFARVAGASVTSLSFKNDQRMLLILPDEGVSPQDILTDPARLEQVLTSINHNSPHSRYGKVILSLPKFNFTSNLKLNDALKEMGVRQAFSLDAEFTGLASTKPLFISDVRQSLSISIDEKGCEVAAYTHIVKSGAAPPEDEIVMKLDRPFIFAITGGAGDAPLFIGVVNNPAAN